ncbi:MAG TPA: hypothetical protein VGK54_03190 [Chloroflexota bacterium]|jgi:hypothetical protein
MLGDKIVDATGKVSGTRVLPSEGSGPRVEVSFTQMDKVLGTEATEMGTYVSTVQADGTVYGEGQGVLMGKGGEMASWRGGGVGRFKQDGSISFRGAIYYQSGHPAWSKLSSMVGVFEYEQSATGDTKGQVWEWK